MIWLNADEKSLVIDINTEFGKSLGDMVIASLWLYAATSEEDKASLVSLSRMIKGEQPAVDVRFDIKGTEDA